MEERKFVEFVREEPTSIPEEPKPAQPTSKLLGLLGSRKFWAAVVGLVLIVAKAYNPDLPVTEEQITSLVYVVIAYILGVAIEDGGRAAGGQST